MSIATDYQQFTKTKVFRYSLIKPSKRPNIAFQLYRKFIPEINVPDFYAKWVLDTDPKRLE